MISLQSPRLCLKVATLVYCKGECVNGKTFKMMKIYNRVANPERFDSDPDPTFNTDADQDLNFTYFVKH